MAIAMPQCATWAFMARMGGANGGFPAIGHSTSQPPGARDLVKSSHPDFTLYDFVPDVGNCTVR
eukprot:1950263-Prymnesium_polylepis.1